MILPVEEGFVSVLNSKWFVIMIRERCLIIKSAGFMQRCWHLLSSFQYENSNYKSTNFPLHVQSFTVQVVLKLLLLIP